MEISNQNSKVILDVDRLKSENIDYKTKDKEKKYHNIMYSDIKLVRIASYKIVQFVFYFIGLAFIGYGFAKKEHKVGDVIYLDIPPTLQEKIIYSILGLCIITFGFYFQRKYGNLKAVVVKHFEGKIKNTQIFTSTDNNQINQLKTEIEKRILSS